jgi:hypothetical protein
VAEMVRDMMARGQVVALQECGQPFLKLLQRKLPAGWQMVKSFDAAKTDQDVILYDSRQLQYQPGASETSTSAYPSFRNRPLQNALFSNGAGDGLRIINAHVPGDPIKPGRDELARYVHGQHREGMTTIALGDNNFERNEMIDAYRKAGFSEFSLHSPWKTNIDPSTKESKCIDHFFVVGTDSSKDLSPQAVLPKDRGLQETIDLLNKG